jgi:hypothetical protein
MAANPKQDGVECQTVGLFVLCFEKSLWCPLAWLPIWNQSKGDLVRQGHVHRKNFSRVGTLASKMHARHVLYTSSQVYKLFVIARQFV